MHSTIVCGAFKNILCQAARQSQASWGPKMRLLQDYQAGQVGLTKGSLKGKSLGILFFFLKLFISAGPEDCANKCSQIPGCKAWTLNVRWKRLCIEWFWSVLWRSNYCWLKKTNNYRSSVDQFDHGDFVRGEPCTSKYFCILYTSLDLFLETSLTERYPGKPKRCECNGHKNAGGAGECNSISAQNAKCGHWCYVDDDAQCIEAKRSNNGVKYRWTCEACLGKQRKIYFVVATNDELKWPIIIRGGSYKIKVYNNRWTGK